MTHPYAIPNPAPVSKSGFFDVGFNRFLSLKIISGLWVFSLVTAALGVVIGLSYGAYTVGQDGGAGALIILGALVGGILFAVFVRVALERAQQSSSGLAATHPK